MKSTTIMSKIKSEFSLNNATSFGGVNIFLAYLEKIKLSEAMRYLSGGKAIGFPYSAHCVVSHHRMDARM